MSQRTQGRSNTGPRTWSAASPAPQPGLDRGRPPRPGRPGGGVVVRAGLVEYPATRGRERRLKNQGSAYRRCPLCRGTGGPLDPAPPSPPSSTSLGGGRDRPAGAGPSRPRWWVGGAGGGDGPGRAGRPPAGSAAAAGRPAPPGRPANGPAPPPPRRPAAGGGGVCPVKGPVRIGQGWGAPRDGGRRRHQGVDLLAPAGTPLVAVTSGRITRLSNVIVAGAGSACGCATPVAPPTTTPTTTTTWSAWASESGPGSCWPGSGATGNARGGPAHLHFQLHPGGGRPVSPDAVVRRWCR